MALVAYIKNLGLVYLYVIIVLLLVTTFIGVWWFVSGTGEQRLKKVFEKHES